MSLGFIISLPCKITCSIYFLHQGETPVQPQWHRKSVREETRRKKFF